MSAPGSISADIHRWRFKCVEIAFGSATSPGQLGRMYSLQINVCGFGLVLGAFHAVDAVVAATP